MPAPTTVDEYLAGLPADRRAVVESMRSAIRAAAPAATETIAYSMPALRTRDGRFLVSYAAYRKHYSLFPASGVVLEALGSELTPYLAEKATIQFPVTAPVPLGLITRVVETRVAELASAGGA
jgi:uncharacterized protein YdhG (YjbR/CyaY superfamily)